MKKLLAITLLLLFCSACTARPGGEAGTTTTAEETTTAPDTTAETTTEATTAEPTTVATTAAVRDKNYAAAMALLKNCETGRELTLSFAQEDALERVVGGMHGYSTYPAENAHSTAQIMLSAALYSGMMQDESFKNDCEKEKLDAQVRKKFGKLPEQAAPKAPPRQHEEWEGWSEGIIYLEDGKKYVWAPGTYETVALVQIQKVYDMGGGNYGVTFIQEGDGKYYGEYERGWFGSCVLQKDAQAAGGYYIIAFATHGDSQISAAENRALAKNLAHRLSQNVSSLAARLGEKAQEEKGDESDRIFIYHLPQLEVRRYGHSNQFTVQYTGGDKAKYNFHGVDGNDTRASVAAKLGKPVADSSAAGKAGEIRYQMMDFYNNKETVSFQINAKGAVTGFVYGRDGIDYGKGS